MLARRMAVAATRRSALSQVSSLPVVPATIAALVVLVGVSLYIRIPGLGKPFWIDEGLSVGIAAHALFDIPDVLR